MIVAYYRVSTRRQGDSGLGLDGQVHAVQAFAAKENRPIIFAYTEIETGKDNNRPELKKAIAHARAEGATLVVAKLDRLARNMAFTAALMDAGVDFVCCDQPYANRLTIHILAAVAEDEARRISERTKAGLAAAKRKGTLLGASNPKCRNLTDAARKKGTRASKAGAARRAKEAYGHLEALLCHLRPMEFKAIAHVLNEKGHTTRRGHKWNGWAVARACKSLGID